MHCPLCKEFVAEGEDLQFHYLLGCSAFSVNREPEDTENDVPTAAVRFRWAKVEPCVERIVHLISSLQGDSIPMHWSDVEGLYESSMTTVPVGKHSCQLAIGGDVVPVQDFDIERNTDVMYIIPLDPEDDEDIEEEIDTRENVIDDDDDPVADLLASRSFQHDEHTLPNTDTRQVHHGDSYHSDEEDRHVSVKDRNPIELSPLYQELLQHQVLHGEPSWIPSSGNQSPTSSDKELEDLIQRAKAEKDPPQLTSQPVNPDDRLLKSPIPVKPIELVELPSEKTGESENNSKSKVEKGDGISSSSTDTYSGSTSKRSSGHSSPRNSPPLSSDASDESLQLQEQSLEESVPRVDELPCPYTGTFITGHLPDNEPTEIVPSPQDRRSSTEWHHSETRSSPNGQPPIDSSGLSQTRASPRDRSPSDTGGQSEARISPLERPSSSQDRPPSARSSHSGTRASLEDRPSSVRSDQLETRPSPEDRPLSVRSSHSETRHNPFERPSSARSTQSESRINRADHPLTPELMQRRFSGPGGYPVVSQERRTPPLSSPRSPNAGIEGRGTGSSHRSHSFTSAPGDLPSPSEPSPSISRHSSARSTPHGTRILPDRPQNGLPVDLAHARESHALTNGSREFLEHSPRNAFASEPRDHFERSSNRHDVNGPMAPMGPSISRQRNGMRNDDERRRSSPDQQTAHEKFAEELSKRTALYEQEIKELKTLNEELCQQLLNLEAAAAITEQDIKRSERLERTVQSLQSEVKELKERCAQLEKENQEMKDEQESLRTVNKLTYEDLNKVNSDLLAERSDVLRRKTYGSPMRSLTDDTIPQIENAKRTLQEKVTRLETEKRDLKHKYNDTKLELEKTKAEKSISEFRLTKARSEADLRDKFDRFTDYKSTTDKDLLGAGTVKTGSSGLGSSRYTWSDTNVDNTYKRGSYTSPSHALLNGSASRTLDDYTRRDSPSIYGTSRRNRGTLDKKIDDVSEHRPKYSHSRHRSLSSESSGSSSLLEYEYGANIRIPYEDTSYASRDKKVELRESGTGRRAARPHSFHAVTSKPTDYVTDHYKHHPKSSSYSTSRVLDNTKPYDYGRTSFNSSFTSNSSSGVRDYSKPFLPINSGEIRLGKRVVVMRSCGNVGRGVVRYVGGLRQRQGSYIGVELDYPEGKHDGTFNGDRYFKCKPNRGIFVKFDKVIMCCN